MSAPPAPPSGVAPNIVWLASYPKSGNTWFRVFLANLLGNYEDTADLDDLGGGPIASARQSFDDAIGLESSDLTAEEIERLRPRAYEVWSAAQAGPVFRKIHDAYSYTPNGEPLVSVHGSRGAVYLIRNPLDVCVSYAHHQATATEEAVEALCSSDHAFCVRPQRLYFQLAQRLSTWSEHVRSWTTAPEIPVHVVRYEDLKARPIETFAAAMRFAGLSYDDAAISRAVELSAFSRLQERERANGFREAHHRMSSFFRKGEIGSWRDALTPDQIERIVSCHRDTMRDFGYEGELQ